MIARHLNATVWVGQCLRVGADSRFRIDLVELPLPRAVASRRFKALTTPIGVFEKWIREARAVDVVEHPLGRGDRRRWRGLSLTLARYVLPHGKMPGSSSFATANVALQPSPRHLPQQPDQAPAHR